MWCSGMGEKNLFFIFLFFLPVVPVGLMEVLGRQPPPINSAG